MSISFKGRPSIKLRPLPRPSRAFASYIASDKEFRGIGPALATRLEARFGEHLRDVIADHDPRVAEIVGEDVAQATFIAYEVKAHEADVIDWLQHAGIDEEVGVRTAIKIGRCWGGEAVQALADNPYVLLSFLPWKIVDQIARHLGVHADDSRRYSAAVEAVLYSHLDANHTAVNLEDVKRGIVQLLGSFPARHTAIEIIDKAVLEGGAVRLGDTLQPYGAAVMEAEVASWLFDASHQSVYEDLALPAETDEALDIKINRYEKRSPYPLTEMQRQAIKLGVTSRVMVLAGYAGSGKTASLRGVCEIASEQGRGLHLMALSGRAAQRISDSTGLHARTIAGFLKSVKEKKTKVGPGDIIIIDEASMVDLPLLWRILREIGEASLLLVGDPAQLPPIGFGLTFHAICKDTCTPKVVLDKVLRQTAESGIPEIAEAVRNGHTVDLPSFEGLHEGITFDACSAEETVDRLQYITSRLISDGVCRDDIQILSPVRNGPGGIDVINRSFHRQKHEKTAGEFFPGRKDIAEDDPIIWTQNDWARGLMNGSLGRVYSAYEDIAHVSLDGKDHDLADADSDFVELAYAISVHKSQGSQWPCVIVPIFQSRILDRTLIYTAITRATKQVILVGDVIALQRSITAPPSASLRKIGLYEHIRHANVRCHEVEDLP